MEINYYKNKKFMIENLLEEIFE
jgi:hypothetical protein